LYFVDTFWKLSHYFNDIFMKAPDRMLEFAINIFLNEGLS